MERILRSATGTGIVMLLLFCVSGVYGQCREVHLGEEFDEKEFPRPGAMFRLGDGFNAKGGEVSVGLVGSEAMLIGRLYFMNPVTGEEQALFTNKDDPATAIVDLGAMPWWAPIVFEYQIFSHAWGDDRRQPEHEFPRYTGPNEAGTYDFDGNPKLKDLAVNGQPMPVSGKLNEWCQDYRWALAGRTAPDTVEFRFEDQHDFDYSDIVFWVTGVTLDSEIGLLPPTVRTIGAEFIDTTQWVFDKPFTVALGPDSSDYLNSEATVYYTTDGTTPEVDTSTGEPRGTTKRYTAPIAVENTTTIKAISWRPSFLDVDSQVVKFRPSNVTEVTYSRGAVLSPPTATPAGTDTVATEVQVILGYSNAADASVGDIYYVLCSDSSSCPLSMSKGTKYASPIVIKPGDKPVLKAFVTPKPGNTTYFASSPVVHVYTITSPTLPTPLADPKGTDFVESIQVALTTPGAPGATIRYTTDGTEPTASSKAYTGPIVLTATTTLKARTFQQGYDPSALMTEKYARVAKVVHAYYKDLDADGRTETAVIVLDIAFSSPPSSVSLSDPFSGHRATIVEAGSISVLSGQSGIVSAANSIVATLSQPFAEGTDFPAGYHGRFDAVAGFSSDSFMVFDSIAPVAAAAVYRRGATGGESGDGRSPDTLEVTFSEPVTLSMADAVVEPFELFQAGASYSLRLRPPAAGSPAKMHAFAVDSIVGVTYPLSGDSLRIRPGEVVGRDGHVQNNAANRKVPLKVVLPPIALSQMVLSPASPDANGTPIPQAVKQAIGQDVTLTGDERNRMLNTQHGTFLVVAPSVPKISADFTIRGWVIVYDVVGNVVAQRRPMAVDDRSRLIWVWDCRNTRDRLVGTGTYLAVVERQDTINGTTVERSKLGVVRGSRQ